MTVDDAIAGLFSKIEAELSRPSLPVFYLGDEMDIDSAIEEIWEDVKEESLHTPFRLFVTLVKTNRKAAMEGDEKKMIDELPNELKDKVLVNVDQGWVGTVIADLGNGKNDFQFVEFTYFPHTGWRLSWTATARMGDTSIQLMPDTFVRGEDGVEVPLANLPPDIQDALNRSIRSSIGHVALISHPANYIVKETPQLTQREARRVENGKSFPKAKLPRYIIVDHDVLVNRLKPTATHASPAPHQRRGHWMRLAERCKHARERGETRVWVRDCQVGDTDFVVGDRRYQVLLDFQDRVKRRQEIT